ncbi:hypothetical protein FORC47_p462 (plasmid) [Bacillus cereus]|jgi:hypothetical protein|nr:hypothetical protein FORC47_p462 [Bacillus cereus]
MRVRTKDFSRKTHSIRVLQEMDVMSLVRQAHSVSTFQGKDYIVLDNGNLYDSVGKREVPVAMMFRYIKCARNSYGVVIAKKSNTCSKLMQVKYVKKNNKVSK